MRVNTVPVNGPRRGLLRCRVAVASHFAAVVAVALAALSCGDKRGTSATTAEAPSTTVEVPGATVASKATLPRLQGAFPSQVAGMFYPSDSAELLAAVRGYLSQAKSNPELAARDIVAILAPHAGYEYSGPIAGSAYKAVAGRPYRTVVVLALSHRQAAAKVSLLDSVAYDTPLGSLVIDQAMVRRLVGQHPEVFEVNEGLFQDEHSLEVQLPFIQQALPGARLVPVIVGVQDEALTKRAGKVLGTEFGHRQDVLFVVSSDLSHYYPDQEAKRYDDELLGCLEKWDLVRWRELAPSRRGMCGMRPMQVLIGLFEGFKAEARQVTRLDFRTSGDTAGDPSRVVGYGALAFSVEANMRDTGEDKDFGPFDLEARQALMDIAKQAVAAASRGERYMPKKPEIQLLAGDGAAFVTLKKRGDLRGCIGHVAARMPLYLCVSEVGKAAAIYDSRFNPVQPDELAQLHYEISVLTAPQLTTPEQVVVGRDGLIVTGSGRSGLLLPQVPREWGWDREQFLDHTCQKAGLPARCWRDPGTKLESFRAIVWGEDDLR